MNNIMIGYKHANGLKRADLAARLGASPQYVSKLLSDTENLSFKSVTNIHDFFIFRLVKLYA